MPGWFDAHAKRSARASGVTKPAVSRRRVLTGGSVVVAGAWAAPLLTSAPAYAYGVSGCATNRICGATTELQYCCAGIVQPNPGATYQCRVEDSRNVCYPLNGNGEFCANNGVGSCGTSGSCNGNGDNCNCGTGYSAPTYFPHTCGGYGATCAGLGSSAPCAPGFACSAATKGTCYQICSGTVNCPSGFTCTIAGAVSTCRKVCADATVCPKGSLCTGGLCA